MKYKTVYFVCNAKLPKELPASKVYDSLAIGAKIDLVSDIILDVSCTLLSPLALEVVRSYLIGRNIVDDINEIIDEIEFRHQGLAQKAIIRGVLDINRKYADFCYSRNIKKTVRNKHKES